MSLLIKKILFTPPSTISTISLFIPNHIFIRTYTAKKPIKPSNSSAPIYAEEELEDGSKFISRVPLYPQKISLDELPPPLNPIKQKSYNLTQEQINEIKQLREQDPIKWTRKKLAEKFECSQFYIGIIAPVSEERRIELEAENIQKIEKMGWKKRFVRNERARRRELW
ncbi:mitochondrial ribosomal protein subunit L20-domain-containing protein [Glomus cerebriforme]|uniref:Mitochondrial ribosomal protein subunit L20-domain-containing protein n=1 Tax=Glomus cerebriforme TaxID=658196 RepID=A0A397SKX7_9GLOM|nr:mitochondrial ribosomal protein subunit L20-domain-containing protein [Glomus cerebriforme]